MPRIGCPLRPLSISASTDSCNIRFSFLIITAGASISNKRCKRIFLLSTRRYSSLRSELAKRPPSSGTNGRKSGGNTGNTSSTIHSGRKFACNRPANTRILRMILSRAATEAVLRYSSSNTSISAFKSIKDKSALIASAPVSALNSISAGFESTYFSYSRPESKVLRAYGERP